MNKIGLFYGKNTVTTAQIAKKIQEAFGDVKVDLIAVEDAWKKEFESYQYLIAGSSTWFDGELPNSWGELMPLLKDLDMKNKKVAIFGLGNQEDYPDNFVDGIGLMSDVFESAGATIVGQTSLEGYEFTKSLAVNDNKFTGLVIDQDNQYDQTDQRIKDWVQVLKKEFK